jgi:predicted regulator of Ras-like GTPase activity (Roadblock/LC7/MglB family)
MAMQGSLRDMSVADLIQVNCQDKKTAKATIKSDGKEARLFFCDGAVTHAELDQTIGEEVIYQILSWDQGEFVIDPGEINPVVSIKRNWSGLLLEGAKRLDESKPDGGIEIDFGSTAIDQKEDLVKGLLQKFGDKYSTLDAVAVIGVDGYVKYSYQKNIIDEAILGSTAAAILNLGRRSLGLVRMDNFQKSIYGGEKNTILVSSINRYSLLLGLYSSPVNKSNIDWNTVDGLVTDLSALI